MSSIVAAFYATAARSSRHLALVEGGSSMTYAELAAEADHIASELFARGVGHGHTVGLYSSRSMRAVAGILGILKTGAAYVPLDAASPRKLLQQIYEDSAPAVMLVQDSLLTGGAEGAFWRDEVLSLDRQGEGACQSAPPAPPVWPDIRPDDPACILYTAGSTGRPRGVVVPHRAALGLADGNGVASTGPDQVVLQLAPLSDSVSSFELWAALLSGGTLAVVPDAQPSTADIAAAISRHGVTTACFAAGVFHLMVDGQMEELRSLRQLLVTGDWLSPFHIVTALSALPACRLITGHGSAEVTGFSCCLTVPQDYTGETPLPMGCATRQAQTRVLDETLQPVAPGSAGELYCGGTGLALGYHRRPGLTAQRFVVHPQMPGARLYRTGDRVRELPDGNLEFLGRVDREVEIEVMLRATGLVQDAAVMSISELSGRRTIRAFVTGAGNAAIDVHRLRDALREDLPEDMVPGSITQLADLPRLPDGKVDRSRLSAAAPVGAEATAARPAASATEAMLVEIFRSVLARDDIGIDDNFLDLGSTSLQLIQAHADIRRALPTDITVIDMFEYPKISALSARMARGATTAPADGPAHSAQDRARRQQAMLARRRVASGHGGGAS